MTISPMRLLVDRQLAIHIAQEHKYRELYMRLDVISRSSKRAAAALGIYTGVQSEGAGSKRKGRGSQLQLMAAKHCYKTLLCDVS